MPVILGKRGKTKGVQGLACDVLVRKRVRLFFLKFAVTLVHVGQWARVHDMTRSPAALGLCTLRFRRGTPLETGVLASGRLGFSVRIFLCCMYESETWGLLDLMGLRACLCVGYFR